MTDANKTITGVVEGFTGHAVNQETVQGLDDHDAVMTSESGATSEVSAPAKAAVLKATQQQPQQQPKPEENKEELTGLDDGVNSGGDLKLTSKDGKAFTLFKINTLMSTLVKTSLDTDPSATEIPIPGVVSEILEKVIEYMNHHKGIVQPIIEKPLRSKVMKEVVKDEWDAIYIDKIGNNRQQLYNLILASNYMGMASLRARSRTRAVLYRRQVSSPPGLCQSCKSDQR